MRRLCLHSVPVKPNYINVKVIQRYAEVVLQIGKNGEFWLREAIFLPTIRNVATLQRFISTLHIVHINLDIEMKLITKDVLDC